MSGTIGASNLINQGTVNRLRASVTVASFPVLNVIPGYLGKRQISIRWTGDTTDFIETQVGAVTSLAPYQMVEVVISLLRTQNLAVQYELQKQLQATIGDIQVIPDTTNFPTYQFFNCAIMSIGEIALDGTNPEYAVTLKGYQIINANLFALT